MSENKCYVSLNPQLLQKTVRVVHLWPAQLRRLPSGPRSSLLRRMTLFFFFSYMHSTLNLLRQGMIRPFRHLVLDKHDDIYLACASFRMTTSVFLRASAQDSESNLDAYATQEHQI